MKKSWRIACLVGMAVLLNIAPAQSKDKDTLIVIVSFSKIEMMGTPEKPEVELAWDVFNREPQQDSFHDYTPPDSLKFALSITRKSQDKDTVLVDTVIVGSSYSYKGPVDSNTEYWCHIKIQPCKGIADVTESVNTEETKYNRAVFKLAETKQSPGFPIFGKLRSYFLTFMEHGKVLWISYILTVVFAMGLVAAIWFGIKLVVLPRNHPRYIRAKAALFWQYERDAIRLRRVKGPVALLIEAGAKKSEQYAIPELRNDVHEQDSPKVYRMEKSIKDTTTNEINRLAGKRGMKMLSFFFQLDHFWSFGVIAPFLGLLGTVTGISKAFGAVSIFSSKTSIEFKHILDRLSSGINEALYTTIGGLVVGIIFLGFYYFFLWRLDSINRAMDEARDMIMSNV